MGATVCPPPWKETSLLLLLHDLCHLKAHLPNVGALRNLPSISLVIAKCGTTQLLGE